MIWISWLLFWLLRISAYDLRLSDRDPFGGLVDPSVLILESTRWIPSRIQRSCHAVDFFSVIQRACQRFYTSAVDPTGTVHL